MLHYGCFKLFFDTVPEGVLVTVLDGEGFVCEAVGTDGHSAALAALEAARASRQD